MKDQKQIKQEKNLKELAEKPLPAKAQKAIQEKLKGLSKPFNK